MKELARFSAQTVMWLALAFIQCLAQSTYEPYTFTTLAGSAGYGSADGTGNAARFNFPAGVAVDVAGNAYVADALNHTIRKMTAAGAVTTLAGLEGSSGSADGTGGAARFNRPYGVAVDGAGNVYVVDILDNTVRKVTPDGAVTTLAGLAGSSGGNDGTGSSARFNQPAGVAVDASGTVYVADTYNYTIRKVTPAGVVTTIAGQAGYGGSADGTGSTARFDAPFGVAVDSVGNVYVADTYNRTIRKMTPAGVVTTLAGQAGSTDIGSADGMGSAARFGAPFGLAVDRSGNVYVADAPNYTIRKVTSAGLVTTIAGLAGSLGSRDGTGSAARFGFPRGVALDGAGNLYVADNYTIRRLASAGAVTTLAGTPGGSGSADGTGSAARFNNPAAVAIDGLGNVYVADRNGIRKVTPAGAVTTVAGLAGITGGVAVDGLGNVYLAGRVNHTIRKVTTAEEVTTLAGQAGYGGSADGTGSAARFKQPFGVAVDNADNVYVADTGNCTIRKITAAGVVTTLAGLARFDVDGNPLPGSTDGTGSAARFNGPQGVAVDSAGNVFVADTGNSTIRKVTAAGVVTTLAGLAGYSNHGSTDGTGSAARFFYPSGVAVDSAANVYVADAFNHTIRKVTPAGVVTTLAGLAGTYGNSDGTGSAARFYLPSGVVVDGAGNNYVADSENNTIRKGAPTSPAASFLGNVRGAQRPGTTLVDSFYDLSGAGSAYFATVAVSSDGGATFAVPATHFTGDGVTTPVAAGPNRHIVWDAGADFSGQFSTKMRVKLTVDSGGPGAEAVSPIFAVDTRAVPTGTLTGLVQGNAGLVASAQVRIDGTGFTVNTGTDGRFTLASVPIGSGYLLKVSAAGFASKQVPGVKVTSGTTDLGAIQLVPLGGPYRLLPLQPDINPPVTQIEDGGVGYRYYLVVAADGKTPASGVKVAVRMSGGSAIPQDGDISDYWAGRIAGIPDADGIVRLRIPALALGPAPTTKTLEVLEAGLVQQTIQATVVPRAYDQVWKHKVGGGVSGKIGVVKVSTSGAYETQVRETMTQNGAPISQQITRIRSDEVRAGVDVGGGLKIGVGAYASAGAGGYAGAQLSSIFHFSPASTDPGENTMKLYVALGDELSLALGPAKGVYDFAVSFYEPKYLDSNLDSVEGDLRVGGYAEAGAGLGMKTGQQTQVGIAAQLSGQREAISGYAETYGMQPQSSHSMGIATSGSASAEVGVAFGNTSAANSAQLSLFNAGGEVELRGNVLTGYRTPNVLAVQIQQTVTLDSGFSFPIPGWANYDSGLSQYHREFTESVTYTPSDSGAFSRLGAQAPIWSAIAAGGQGTVIKSSLPALLMNSLSQYALSEGSSLAYADSVYASAQTSIDLDLDLDAVAAGVGANLQGELERGAEVVNERGRILRSKRMALEAYPVVSPSLFPQQSIIGKELGWLGYAAGPIGQALNRVEHAVAAVGDTVIQAGKDATHAVLHFGQGAMNAGAQVITKYFPNPFASGGPHLAQTYRLRSRQPMDSSTPNLAYGIGGIYRFESTNSFQGTGTLTIAYSAAEVAGLNPADLRMYYLPDGTNRWQLVGGTVNVASNTVSGTISRLGTYTLAPPLPTGDLQLTPSTNTLAADGASQLTVVVTNLMLNTGNSATQQWGFTATAVGVTILNPDQDTNAPGVQVVSTNAAITLFLRAPVGGTVAQVSLASVVGDASGSVTINLMDNTAPATPTGVTATAGQSRIWVSWQTNNEPDLAGYRVYYRLGASGPPWDGTATVEGAASPVMVTGTNCLLRGLALGTNYFVAVSAVDTTGNESPLSAALQVTTTQAAPSTPTAVAVSFGADGTNILMWALSEDDGYNDRDVVRYEVWRAVLPGGNYVKVGEVAAGIGVFSEPSPTVATNQYLAYAISAVAASGLSSPQVLANRPPSGELRFGPCQFTSSGEFQLTVYGQIGTTYALQASTDLVTWTPLFNFLCTNSPTSVVDTSAPTLLWRFYRIVTP